MGYRKNILYSKIYFKIVKIGFKIVRYSYVVGSAQRDEEPRVEVEELTFRFSRGPGACVAITQVNALNFLSIFVVFNDLLFSIFYFV